MDSWKLYSASAMFTHRTNYMRDHTFSKYAKFFEKLLFLTRWYVHVTLKKRSLRNAYTRRNYFLKLLLRKKCPYSDFFLRRIFPHLDWIRHEIKKKQIQKGSEIFWFLSLFTAWKREYTCRSVFRTLEESKMEIFAKIVNRSLAKGTILDAW